MKPQQRDALVDSKQNGNNDRVRPRKPSCRERKYLETVARWEAKGVQCGRDHLLKKESGIR